MSEQILTVAATVNLPHIPNFLRLCDGQTMPIEAFTEEGLRHLGAAWTEELVARAKQRGMNGRPPEEEKP